ncbi:hypothetical protein V1282_002415 [Nitrobacteraceae bacterium AZCC 2146]
MAVCNVEHAEIVQRSLINIHAAKKRLLPLTVSMTTSTALTLQIELRKISLSEIRTIRSALEDKLLPWSSADLLDNLDRINRDCRVAGPDPDRTSNIRSE